MIHLTLNQISAYIDAELPDASVELVRLHLSSCLECTERFGYVEEQEEALARLLVHDPGDAFFASFADRVLGPTPAPLGKESRAVASPARASSPQPAKEPEALASPAPAKQSPAVASPANAPNPPAAQKPAAEPTRPVAIEASAQTTQRVATRNAPSAPARRDPRRRAGGAGRFLIPAAALLLIASGIAVIATRPGLLKLDLPIMADRRAAPPSQESSSQPAPQPDAPSISPSGASGPDNLERAASRSAEAQRTGTAAAYDEAAGAWESALPGLQDDGDELAAGRREIAWSRLAAWRAGPTPARKDAATKAVRAYLLCAPPGSERDRAWTWLAELKR